MSQLDEFGNLMCQRLHLSDQSVLERLRNEDTMPRHLKTRNWLEGKGVGHQKTMARRTPLADANVKVTSTTGSPSGPWTGTWKCNAWKELDEPPVAQAHSSAEHPASAFAHGEESRHGLFVDTASPRRDAGECQDGAFLKRAYLTASLPARAAVSAGQSPSFQGAAAQSPVQRSAGAAATGQGTGIYRSEILHRKTSSTGSPSAHALLSELAPAPQIAAKPLKAARMPQASCKPSRAQINYMESVETFLLEAFMTSYGVPDAFTPEELLDSLVHVREVMPAGVEHQEYEGRLDTREGWEHLMYRLEVEEKAFVDNAGLGFASFATMDSAVDTKSEAGRDVESDVESGAHDGINASSEAPAGAAKGWFRRLLGSSA